MKINKKIAEKALTSQVEEKIENLITEHVQHCRRHMSWIGEHRAVVEKIVKLMERKYASNS